MADKQALLRRLEDIGQSLARTGRGRALIALGSVGLSMDRLDQYSDLDFFAVVTAGQKAAFISDLQWMAAACPIVYAFQNTADGHKVLFEDDIFAEMAVFEEQELARIPFEPGRIVWKMPDFDEALAVPSLPTPEVELRSVEWLLGEALTNLYVGLNRFQRGERLSGARFVQGHAVDRVVDLAPFVETELPVGRDIYAAERRFEQRCPQTALSLPQFMQGYERTPQSARAMIAFLEQHFELNAAMCAAILALC